MGKARHPRQRRMSRLLQDRDELRFLQYPQREAGFVDESIPDCFPSQRPFRPLFRPSHHPIARPLPRVQHTNARCLNTLSPFVHVHHTTVQGDRIVKAIPMRRLGDPAELDGLLLMLASERASSYMTGSVLTLDGGIMLSNL